MTRFEQILIELEIIDKQYYNTLLNIAKKHGGTIPLNLVRIGRVEEEHLLQIIRHHFKVPIVTQNELQSIDLKIIDLIPHKMAESFRIVPFQTTERELSIVISDPTDTRLIEELSYITNRKIIPFCALESVISWALLKYYGIITDSGSSFKEAIEKELIPDEQEALPLPLVTRKKTPMSIQEEKPVVLTEEQVVDETKQLGGWDSPFELKRITSLPPHPHEERKTYPPTKRRPIRKTPTKVAIPAVDKPEEDNQRGQPEAELKVSTSSGHAVEKTKQIIQEKEAKGKEKEVRDSSVSVIPVVLIGNKEPATEKIEQKDADIEKEKRIKPKKKEEKTTIPPAGVGRQIDISRINRWVKFIRTISDSDEIMEKTLAFLDNIIGPSVFLRKKKDTLIPYQFSPTVKKRTSSRIKTTEFKQPEPTPLFQCLRNEKAEFLQVEQKTLHNYIVEINPEVRWEKKYLILAIPVTVGKVKAGIILSIPSGKIKVTDELIHSLNLAVRNISNSLGNIILMKKRKEK